MNGGTREYTMSNIVSPDGKTMMSCYQGSNYNYSGYTGIVYKGSIEGDYASYKGSYTYPEDKYIDKYSFSTSTSMRSKSKMGDGIREVYNTSIYGWYDDSLKFIYNTDPWFNRGGYYGYGSDAGVFRISSGKGSSDDDFGSRFSISQ